jgi:hypothetical protein
MVQMMRLFEQDLDRQDPFYIEGQEWQTKEDTSLNYCNNFIDSEQIEDFDDFQQFQG